MSRKALFLDRDGIINRNFGYVHSTAQFEWVDGIITLCQQAQRKGYALVIVTNQSGIARGYYSRETYREFARWIEHQLWLKGVQILHTYHCPHHPRVEGPFGQPCTCRKPRPGMLVRAAREWRIDLSRSLMVGDSMSDVHAALRAGLKHGILFSAEQSGFGPALSRGRQLPYYRCSKLPAIRALL